MEGINKPSYVPDIFLCFVYSVVRFDNHARLDGVHISCSLGESVVRGNF